MMKHTDILDTATSTLKQRGVLYGPAVEVFENVSKIASTICVKEISPYDVAMIMTVMKLVRMRESRTVTDHYVDGVNYLAMAGEFANLQSSKDIAFGDDIRELISRKEEPIPEQVTGSEPEPSVEDMAAKLAPEPVIEPRKKNVLKTADLPIDFTPSSFTSETTSQS